MNKITACVASIAALIAAPAFAAEPVYNWIGWYAGINFGVGWGTSNNATTTTTITPLDDGAQFFQGTSPSGSLALASSVNAAVNQKGPIGGGQFGYNWQLAPRFVVSFEGDIQGSAISDRGSSNAGTTESFAGISNAFASCSSFPPSCMVFTTPGAPAFAKAALTANSAEVLAAAWSNPALSASGIDSVTADVNWLGTVRARAGYLVTPNFLVYATGGLAMAG